MRLRCEYSAMRVRLAFVLLLLSVATASADSLSAAAQGAISAYRRQHGLSAVTVDGGLMQVARQQAHAMARAGVLSHSVGGSFASRISAANRGLAAENIAVGVSDFSSALDMWKRSAGHRANLLKGGITQIGVASAQAPNSRKVFWALVLAGSAEPRSLRKPPRMMRRAAIRRPGSPDLIKFCGESPAGMPRIACE
jgi:uncharacterized protein YkwD